MAEKDNRTVAAEPAAAHKKAHEPLFTVKVSVDGIGEATATARSRKEADGAAAAKLLKSTLQ